MNDIIKQIKKEEQNKVHVTFSIDQDLLKLFKAECKKKYVPQSKVVEKLIENFLYN